MDSSEDLDDLIEFKLGDELCPVPENTPENRYNDSDDDEDNIELPMKKINERRVERPTIGVPPPGTDPNENFDYEDGNNGIFQSKKDNNEFELNDDVI